jgi:type I restriction enzyme, S subunit
MSFPRYPAYKPSGVEWLGEVPEHWSVNRFKLSIDSCTNGVWGNEAGNDENDVICIRVADFDRHRLEAKEPDEPTIRNVSERDIEQRSLRNGDLLIEKSGGGEKQPVGAVVLYSGTAPAVCSNFVARMRLRRDLSASFWRYAHHAAYSARLNTKSIKQTSGIQNLDQQQYLDESAAYPPLEEQFAIAGFLDRETAKIDALIAEQQRLIELLQEKRQAVISHAVTKGLNPNTPMKDSGVEWMGEVPEHWLTTQLGRLCIDVADGPHYSPVYVNTGVPFLSARNIKVDRWELDDVKYVSESDCNEFDKRAVPEMGDVLYTKGGTTGVARVVDLPHRFQVWVHVAILKLRKTIADPHFIAYALNSSGCYEQSQLFTRGATNQDLGLTRMVLIQLALPPLDEQMEISSELDLSTKYLDELLSKAQDSLLLLGERRSALISAAVTGQIDVRGLAAKEEP